MIGALPTDIRRGVSHVGQRSTVTSHVADLGSTRQVEPGRPPALIGHLRPEANTHDGGPTPTEGHPELTRAGEGQQQQPTLHDLLTDVAAQQAHHTRGTTAGTHRMGLDPNGESDPWYSEALRRQLPNSGGRGRDATPHAEQQSPDGLASHTTMPASNQMQTAQFSSHGTAAPEELRYAIGGPPPTH